MMERPDLTDTPVAIQAYIESLEAEVQRLQSKRSALAAPDSEPEAEIEPAEPPTSINLITLSANNLAKRTPRHWYGRQRRGGMGVFDLETADPDYPHVLVLADENQPLLLFSNFGRAFRMMVNDLAEAAGRAKGQTLTSLFQFRPHERIVAALPGDQGEYVALGSQRGWVRRIRSNYLSKSLIPGMSFHDVKEGGYLTCACWTVGNADLLMATRQGQGIRFMETQVPGRGCLGMRVDVTDELVGITAVRSDSTVLFVGHDGKGSLRHMAGFAANKAPGSGGKAAFKTDKLVTAVTVSDESDIFIISKLGKIIRFRADEVPVKEGVVQGVNCMALRADEVTAVTVTRTV